MRDFWKDETGASAAEYALILAIVTTGIAGAAITLGNTISTAIETAANCIENPEVTANCDLGGAGGEETGDGT